MRKTLTALVSGLACLGSVLMPAAAQGAKGGNMERVEFKGIFVSQDICDFPVRIRYHSVGHIVSVETRKGTIVRAHFTENDIFTANGVSLRSTTYRFNNHLRFDENGDVVSAVQTGVIVRVPLPNGETFMVAGRADFLDLVGDFVITPTNGVTKNLDDFCAALSG